MKFGILGTKSFYVDFDPTWAKNRPFEMEFWLLTYFVWVIRKKWSQDDLPTLQIPGPEDFAENASL
jgi:hypothetical protein